MKKITLPFCFRAALLGILFQFALGINTKAQLTTTRAGNYGKINYLVNNVLLGSGIIATNITYQGIDTSFGFFNGTKSNIGMDTGLIITNGTITLASGPNRKTSDKSDGKWTTYAYSTTDGWPSAGTYRDTDLANLISTTVSNTYSCAVLQFDFVANSDSIQFQYSFGSNEEPYYVGSKYLDDFGFFLSGPGIAGPFSRGAINLAVINKNTAVYIDSVNCTINSTYYVCNWPSSAGCSSCPATPDSTHTTVGYNGFTTVLTAKASVQCGKKYHIKLGVANIGNGKFDSGVFLKGGSFKPSTAGMTVSTPSPICSGGSTTITANGATSYTWNPATGLSATTGASVTANPTVTTTYTVVGNISGSCDDTAKVTVIVNPTPTVTAVITGISPFICSGDTMGIIASGGTSYTWSPATGLNATTGAHVIANLKTTTTYTVTGTTGSCSNTATITINVFPTPTVTVTPSAPAVCPGGSVNMTASGASTYSWSPTTGLNQTTGSAVTSTPTSTTTYTVVGTSASGCKDTTMVTVTVAPGLTVTISPTNPSICKGDSVILNANGAANYTWSPGGSLSCTNCPSPTANPSSSITYTVTGTSGSCTAKDSVTITISTKPVITIAASPPSVCSGSPTTLTAGGGTTYSWSPSTGLSATTGISVTATPSVATTYMVTGTNAGGCNGNDSITITISPAPTVSLSAGSPAICTGASTTIAASGASSYSWSPSTGLSATTGTSVTANPPSNQTYTVIGANGAGCNDTANITISVIPPPSITVSPSSPSVCAGGSAVFTASGASSYVWSSGETTDTIISHPSTATTYTVIGTNSSGCKDSTTVTISVNPLPIVSVNAADSSVCPGGMTTMNASGASSYIWTPASGLSCTTCANPNANPSTTTTYTVVGITAAGCTDTTKATITVNPNPAITITLSGNDTVCAGQSITMTANGGSTYIWKPGTALSCTSCTNTVVTPATSPVTYTVVGSNGSCSDSATQTIYLYPPLNVTMNNDTVCAGKQAIVQVIVSGGKSGYTYLWNNSLGSGSGPFTVSPASSTCYVCTVTDGCGTIIKDSAIVYPAPAPVVKFTTSPENITGGQYVTFMNYSTGATSYIWTFGDGGSSNAFSPYYQYNIPGNYIVYLVGTNKYGCADSASDTVYVTGGITVPNVFTPNGDGNNDVFHVKAGGMKTYQIEIFNRWGQKVFESDSPMIDWTGRSTSGVQESDGTYYYIIKATDFSNKAYNLDGYIELIR